MGANKRPIPRFAPSAGAAEILRAALSRGGDPWPEFAARFAGYLGVAHAVPAPSAREALAAILGSLGLPKGGDVLMPALTFHSIPTVVRRCGFEVGFVDIDPGTLCLDAKFLKGAMKPGTVAILPVHLHGRAADMDAISELSRRYGLAVIEDCAQAAGGMYGGRRLGGFGDAAFFSFHPAKNLSALWAGMAVTGRSDVAAGVESAMASHPLISLIELAGP
ncbi:MAG: DegT/DnrJ/EryC1/StrS family aminotransferase, partial [Deltaproteobacteria bacterium]|nr:DegT/DnrJ/EryC1/StrS family aminotransferase [Deltaproteobacteria bacterium]